MVEKDSNTGPQGRERFIALCEAALVELTTERAATKSEPARRHLDRQIEIMREMLRGAIKLPRGL